jgi:SagB-type dehydrogenase family enzyme
MVVQNKAQLMHMNTSRRILAFAVLVLMPLAASAQQTTLPVFKLNKPDLNRGLPVMQAMAARRSADNWSDKVISLKDLSDLIWAANGINRAKSGKRTAPSALNAQDIDIYVFTTRGVYRYDAKKHVLRPIADGDHRSEIIKSYDPTKPAAPIAPVEFVLVSDGTRFPFGTQEQRREWGAIDAGIVSQNISVFCAATELATRPRGSVDREKLHTLLGLKDGAYAILDHPVGYSKAK